MKPPIEFISISRMGASFVIPLAILVSLVCGAGLEIFGIQNVRRSNPNRKPALGITLIVTGALLQGWWILGLSMLLFKVLVLKQSP